MRRLPSVSCSLLLVVLSGCLRYVPAGGAPLVQGTPVRVHLARPSSFELSALTAHNIGLVDGEIVRVDPGEIVLSAAWLEAVTGEGYSGRMWTVRIDEGDVRGLEVKRFSRWRTAALVTALVAGTYLGFEALGGGGGESGQPGGGGVAR